MPYLHRVIPAILFLLIFFGFVYFLFYSKKKTKINGNEISSAEIEHLLNTEIDFYQKINSAEKKINFKNRVIHFLQNVRITSVGSVSHTLLDKVLIASSAMIPLYHFPDWEYRNIREVILYDDHFDPNYKVDENKHIMGMVGEGSLNDTMILSLRALREGFERNDGSNTAIHEFVHLIDKADGNIDGVPEYLIPKQGIQPWLRHIHETIRKIQNNETQINPYATTNEGEFLAVISEYFFEKPALLSRNHPALFNLLSKMFKGEENQN